jgi:hypothetical protein
MVAPGQPAGGIHQHALEGIRMRVGQPHLGAAVLIKAADFGLAIARRDNRLP